MAIPALLLSEGRFGSLPVSLAGPQLPKFAGRHAKLPAAKGDPMDRALYVPVIEASVQHALHLARTGDEMDLARRSGEWQHALRSEPSLAQLDRCAAFDDAVVELQDRDPLRDQGPFSKIAETGRAWSGATPLLDDSVAIYERLDRIRLQVELALAPAVQPQAP